MAVNAPRPATTRRASGLAWKIAYSRATMNTPAATIVAEWMSAETGVGPSMASGSHTCSGNWPLFPIAPQNRSSATSVTWPCGTPPPPTKRATSPKSKVPARMLRRGCR